MSPNASYRTTARCRSASDALGAQRRDLLAQPVHVLGQRVDARSPARPGAPAGRRSRDQQGDDGDDERDGLHAPSLGRAGQTCR